MKRLTLLAAIVWLISSYGMYADAQIWSTGSVAASHYVGPSKSTNDGNTHGIVGMNALCQATYGPTAHMCNVDEFFGTAAFTKVKQDAPFMWIEPAFHECYYDSSLGYATCRVAGLGRVRETTYDLSCLGWKENDPSESGLSIFGDTSTGADINIESCAHPHPAACCAP
jgi:hypothetical protein